MNAAAVFFVGIALLILFAWYFFTDSERGKRILGSILAVVFVAVCVQELVKNKITLGLDLQGGTSFLIRLQQPVDPETNEPRAITSTMLDQAVEVIRKRVDELGTSEPVIAPQGSDRILVQIPGLETDRLEYTREQLRKVAKLEFRKVHPRSSEILNGFAAPDPNYVALPMIDKEAERAKKDPSKTEAEKEERPKQYIIVRKKTDISGDHVTRASAGFGLRGWEVNLSLDRVGGDLFGKLTEEVAADGSQLAIILDGQVLSAPGLTEGRPIYGGNVSITGDFTEQEARGLASALENPLATPVSIEEERSADASLGQDSINSGLVSGMYGVILTVLCVLVYYRFAGLIANIALAINVVILFGAMATFGSVLTLPGIAGVILTLGMAIDANVLIYERLREEMAAGKPLKAAINGAFDKAFSAIFDSNLTTLITSIILFYVATGPVKGFAITLTIGIIASMFTALVVTRNLFQWAIHLGWIKTIKMTNLIKATNYDFLRSRRLVMIASVVAILGSFAVFAIRGKSNFGVDFQGGDRIVFEATKGQRPSDAEVRAALNDLNLGDVVVQTERSAAKEFITVRGPHNSDEQIIAQMAAKFPEAGLAVEQSEKVGPLVGSELAKNSGIALLLGMLGIFIYLTPRFEFSFAMATLLAMVHDVVVTMGIFSLLGRELSLTMVGAILTIAGYSVNDTIVVFDRVREGIKAGEKGSVIEIMNRAINDTLSRTILTGGVTLLTTAILYFFGGPVLNDFALTIFIGVVVGTYSSIFVAAPIVLWWSGRGAGLHEEIKRAEFRSGDSVAT